MSVDYSTWVKRAEVLKPESRLYINGSFVDAASGKTFDDISARDQQVIAKIAAGGTPKILTAQLLQD